MSSALRNAGAAVAGPSVSGCVRSKCADTAAQAFFAFFAQMEFQALGYKFLGHGKRDAEAGGRTRIRLLWSAAGLLCEPKLPFELR